MSTEANVVNHTEKFLVVNEQPAVPAKKLSPAEKKLFDQPIIADTEKVVLAMNWPGYAYGRCYNHGIFALPDADGTIRASHSISCPDKKCALFSAVLITDPLSYMKSHAAPMLSFEQLIEKLEAEGISKKSVGMRGDWPDWAGQIDCIEVCKSHKTKNEPKQEQTLYGLRDHGLYIHAVGHKAPVAGSHKKKWHFELHKVSEEGVETVREILRNWQAI